VALFAGLLSAGMQCDEICRTDTTDWRYTSGAWQWYAIGALGAVTFAAGILFVACVISRRPLHALACLGLGAAAVGVALGKFLVNPGSDQDLDLTVTFWLVTALVSASGIAAALLAGGAASRGQRPELRLVARRVVAGPLLGKAALFAFVGWGFWRGGFRPRGRTG
jgi:hypothetical protein